jgi:hypothetical protein
VCHIESDVPILDNGDNRALVNAAKSHLSAYIKYQLMLSDITRKTFYDFKTNEVIK